MDGVTPAEHPDHDLLADLAAQTVLAPELAARVEAHVRGCARCANLLAEAEGMQAALRSMPPEPMPADISGQIEQLLISEHAARQAAGGTSLQTAPAPGTAAGGTGELPTRRSLRAGGAPASPAHGAAPAAIPGAAVPAGAPGPATPARGSGRSTGSMRTVPLKIGGSGASGPSTGRIRTGSDRAAPVSRLRRMASARPGARRQALEEQRSDQPSRLVPLLRVAAGVIVVLGLGAGAVQLVSHLGSGSSGDSTASSAAGGGGAPVLTRVLATGTDYTKESLSKQVKGLVTQSQKQASFAANDQATTPTAKGAEVSAPLAASPSPGLEASSGDLLRSASALRACLTAIGAPDAQPVAVDLARYRGRDAAILVLPADNGQYDVWVVARTCAPEDDGTLDVETITP